MDESPKRYKGAGQLPELVEYRAILAAQLRARGVPLATFVEANNETPFPVALRTLQLHVSRVTADQTPLSAEKNSGARAKLTAEQWDVVAGAILLEPKKTDLQWAATWIKTNFDVDVSLATVSRHIAELHLTFRLTGGRPRPQNFSASDYVCQYYEFVKLLHDTGFFNYDPKRIICVDFVTNSRRLDREKTIALIGSKQQKLSAGKPQYTNSYCVAVSMDDDGEMPAIMYTHDPTFDPNGPRAGDVLKWCKKWDIDRDRIVYEKSKKKYCKEAQAQVAHFKALYRAQLRGARILHDKGGSFKKDGELLLADGADRCLTFPVETHGEHSVLDNKVFSVAKAQWRTERGGTDFAHDDLYLLWCIDWADKKAIRSYWRNNFMLDAATLSLKAAEDHLRGKTKSLMPLEEHYVGAYESWRAESDEDVKAQQWAALDSYLDGDYWK
jgi:hypothetical protein